MLYLIRGKLNSHRYLCPLISVNILTCSYCDQCRHSSVIPVYMILRDLGVVWVTNHIHKLSRLSYTLIIQYYMRPMHHLQVSSPYTSFNIPWLGANYKAIVIH